jgi:outer membrane protein OmpA-like peptidoglycan-associated protein
MTTYSKRIWLAATLAVAGLSLSACATEDYVDQHIAVVHTRVEEVNARVDGLSGQVTALSGRVDGVERATQSAQARADAAAKMAEGKFMMTEVSRVEVTFDTGKSGLSDEAKATLTSLVERLKSENKNVFLEIKGHADVRGGKQYNRQLGRERAGAVGRFLADQGVPGNKMALGSWGEDAPKTDEKTAESHAENRRVEIIILG